MSDAATELDTAVRARYALRAVADQDALLYLSRLLSSREHTLRHLLDQPPALDPRDDPTAEAMGDGNFRRRRLPTLD